jgi:hypothetical protein
MNVSVLLSSGDYDTWTDVRTTSVDMTLGGALVIKAFVEGTEHLYTAAIYAPGMWMKFEQEEPHEA